MKRSTTIQSERLNIMVSASDTEVNVLAYPASTSKLIDSIGKFIAYVSTFDVDEYTWILSDKDEVKLNTDRVSAFVNGLDAISVSKNTIPAETLIDIEETKASLQRRITDDSLLATFSFKKRDLGTTKPEVARVECDLVTFGKLTYMSYVACEVIELVRKAFPYEEFWDTVTE